MNERIWLLIAVVALVTALIRFLPFILFGNKRRVPPIVNRLGKTLPFAVMGMLVVYCLRNMSFSSVTAPLAEIIASLSVVLIHLWRRNTLLSIIVGTVCYMLLVQLVL